MDPLFVSLRLCSLIIFFALTVFSQVPLPKDVLGWTPGDDRKLASWAQTVDYFRKLDAASNRVMFQEIGKTTMGRPFVYATISSPENLKNLEKYKKINSQLADPRTFNSRAKFAERLIEEGKTIVLITCGIHSTEVGGYLSSMLIAHRLANSNEPEIQKILNNTIVLLVPSLNPDGVDIVNNWYQKTLGTKFEGTDPPELYHKYVGHDNNRDWYAFTQVETQLTVDKIHNVWHPQIVHDIHQQGQNGSRLFLPPYMQPVEPNVPKQIVEGYTELGNYMADSLRKMGYQGITTNSTYDAWTPARAYSHYHGGVRILSETASARLATPITVDFERMRVPADDGYDPKVESANFGPVWKGGEWKLRNITDYMTTAAFALLNHAADNRERWLTRFYEIGKEAVRPRKDGELTAYIIEEEINPYDFGLWYPLFRGGVEIQEIRRSTINGKVYPDDTKVIPMEQPYSAFAKALIESQGYPDLKDQNGNPIPPYDVTGHSLALLTNTKVDSIFKRFRIPAPPKQAKWDGQEGPPARVESLTLSKNLPKIREKTLYRSALPVMDEGWTRWVFEKYSHSIVRQNFEKSEFKYRSVLDTEIKSGNLIENIELIVFPDQGANQILNGYLPGTMPDEYVGGVGKEGVENLKKFVESGGTLVFLNRSSQFAIEQFKLPVKDVTRGVARKDFYIPGSILRTELDTTHPIAKGMPQQSIAWFGGPGENSPAFEIQTDPLAQGGNATVMERAGLTRNFRIIATYPKDPKQILLSGWALGVEKIAGKAALVEFTIGKGKIILFGFRPQYRGQSLATFPLLFNAISQ
jgi:hypothetical protein